MHTLFTDRLGGQSQSHFQSLNLGDHVGDDPADVAANRRTLTERCGPTQYMSQVHGNEVLLIDSIIDPAPQCDAIVTATAGITLGVLTADCIPLLLHSDSVIAAVHVGRKGLINDVAVKTVELMRTLGAEKISAQIGPSICGKCYEVGSDVFDEVVALHPSASSHTVEGIPALDLPAALTEVLSGLDVDVTKSAICTLESETHFSYRKSKTTGRQAGLIWL